MPQDKYKVAVLGATGNVGRLLLQLLAERDFPASKVKALASERSVGESIKISGTRADGSQFNEEHKVELACPEAFDDVDIVFASAGGSVSEKLAPEIVKRGALLIDNSSKFRMDPEVPLVVPEVNADDITKHKGIIANPNCSTAPLVVVLKPLDEKFKVKRVVVSTYQSISGAGKAAMDELKETTKLALDAKDFDNKAVNQKIAFNLIPQIDVFTDNDYTKEEMKLINESKKMMGRDDLQVTCTAVRVPVMISHSESVNIEFESSVDAAAVRAALKEAPALEIQDDPSSNTYPMPLDVTGKDPVYVGRIRNDESQANTVNMWIVSDNLRIGAALNAIRIGEKAIELAAVKAKTSA